MSRDFSADLRIPWPNFDFRDSGGRRVRGGKGGEVTTLTTRTRFLGLGASRVVDEVIVLVVVLIVVVVVVAVAMVVVIVVIIVVIETE